MFDPVTGLIGAVGLVIGILIGSKYPRPFAAREKMQEPFSLRVTEARDDGQTTTRHRFEPEPGEGWGRAYIEELVAETPGDNVWEVVWEYDVRVSPVLTDMPELAE